MPPNNKKKRTAKKNKGKAIVRSFLAAEKRDRAAASQKTHVRPEDVKFENLPTFHSNSESRKEDDTGGYYEIYKRSTRNFCLWMRHALPTSRIETVNDLKKCADQILELNAAALESSSPSPVVPPKDIMDDLSKSIHYREMFTLKKFGESGDEGHSYMVDVLKYCRKLLGFGLIVAKVAVENIKSDTDQVKDEIGGRFSALVLSCDSDDKDEDDIKDMEESVRQRKFPTFKAPEKPKEDISIEEVLINGDDRFQAIALLETMQDLMEGVDFHYQLLKRFMRGEHHLHEGSGIQLLMECAVVVNMATESIQVAENSLYASHPHISSFYHVLAVVFLTNHIAGIKKLINPVKLEKDEHMALKFVAEIVESCFHNSGQKQMKGIKTRFVKKSGLKPAQVEHEADVIFLTVSLEVQLSCEEKLNSEKNRLLFEASGWKPHSWLKSYHIGGQERSIINTQSLIQRVMDVVQDNIKLVGKRGFFGDMFNENTSPASSIRGGLDEAFAACILPELFATCKHAPFHNLPTRPQLIIVLDLLATHLKGQRDKPVPIALTFGLHAMLTSIFILQGEGDLARLASCAKESYNKLFAQLDAVSDPAKTPHNTPTFYQNVAIFKDLVNFAKPVKSQLDIHHDAYDPSTAATLAFWNPVIGGEYMLYATYICSIGLGSATVDSFGQLRFTMHLYHALRHRDPSLDIPFLRDMDKVFSSTKAVWVGGRPEKGTYSKHFWLSWGTNLTEASRLGAADASDFDASVSFLKKRRGGFTDITRKLDEILPEEYSNSYRRLVQRDFTGEVHEYMKNDEVPNEASKNGTGLLELLKSVNMTRDAMDDDEDIVLPINFTAVGCILLEFTNALSTHLGWDTIIHQFLAECPDEVRTGRTTGGKKIKPGSFNASDLNLVHQGMAHFWGLMLSRFDRDVPNDLKWNPVIEMTADFTVEYFKKISKDRYFFFVEPQTGLIGTATRNPLEGLYPYGRTGKTFRDPHVGILHLKYSKADKPVARLVKPGKCTPHLVTSDGEIQNPYTEEGSKMPRLPNGKYRHIASYTLPELIALGWDGARYVSTHGRHAAIGNYVPFIPGYDSDVDDEYEPIDVQAGKEAGIIGLPREEIGHYMLVPNSSGDMQLVQLN